MKFRFKHALIAALIVGMVPGVSMLVACATYGAWDKFCIAAAFEFIMAFVLGGLLDE